MCAMRDGPVQVHAADDKGRVPELVVETPRGVWRSWPTATEETGQEVKMKHKFGVQAMPNGETWVVCTLCHHVEEVY